jgi:hypothetical protein
MRFPYFSSYLFAGNSPISSLDIKGDSIYVLFYTTGNSRGDEMFEAAAFTRKHNIENDIGFDKTKDIVVVIAIQDVSTISNKMNEVVNEYSNIFGKVQEFGIWSHSSLQGPVGTIPCSQNKLGEGNDEYQMSEKGWSEINFNWANSGKGAVAGFYGCRSGKREAVMTEEPTFTGDGFPISPAKYEYNKSFVERLSANFNLKDVDVLGQRTYSFDSKYVNKRKSSKISEEKYISRRWKEGNLDWRSFRLTYMVGGIRGRDDFFYNDQDLALPMRKANNGETVDLNYYQPGRKK